MEDKKDDRSSIYLMFVLFCSAFEHVRLSIDGGNPFEFARAKENLVMNAEEAQRRGLEEGRIIKIILRGGLAARERKG
ncbi:MAG TPA: hypothetical protein VMW04_01420 [Patescibacteria group bacterium]|nr:hypothetical protein [Patescibacteria group bacterium]